MQQIVDFVLELDKLNGDTRENHIQRTEETLAVAFEHPDGDMMVRICEQP